jgi:hypothetical protein
VTNHKLNFLAQIDIEPNPELTRLGAPEIWRYITDEANRRVAEVVISAQAFERPYFLAPGTPAERVAALRAGFDQTMRDPRFLAEAEKIGMDISPKSGSELEQIVRKLYDTPKPILDQAP